MENQTIHNTNPSIHPSPEEQTVGDNGEITALAFAEGLPAPPDDADGGMPLLSRLSGLELDEFFDFNAVGDVDAVLSVGLLPLPLPLAPLSMARMAFFAGLVLLACVLGLAPVVLGLAEGTPSRCFKASDIVVAEFGN